jgi:hypothetical protein
MTLVTFGGALIGAPAQAALLYPPVLSALVLAVKNKILSSSSLALFA